MAYTKLNLKNGTTLTETHLNHIEDGIFNKQDTLVSGTNIKTINGVSILGSGDLVITGSGNVTSSTVPRLVLPKIIRWEVGKPLYIFKHAVTTAFNYENYNIQVISSTPKDGKDRHRYYVHTPTSEGTVTLKFKMYDNGQNLIDTKTVSLVSVSPKLPSKMTTVFFIGDSLTYYNRISDEFYRVMTSSDAATIVDDTVSIYRVNKPAGRKSGNVQLIGTQKQNYKGWIGKTYHEGRSGWAWSNFNGSSSPFYINGKIDFNAYLTNKGFATPDVVYIGMGWNDTRTIPIDDTGVINTNTLYNNAKTFLTNMTSQLPNTKIRLWVQNVPGRRGGIGNHVYGATDWSDEHRLKLFMQAIGEMYIELASEFDNVEVVWSIGMVDSEYGLQESNADINYRIASDEVLGVDYVHPADSGMFQIADAIISDFMHCIEGGGTETEDTRETTPLSMYKSAEGNAVMYYQDVFKYFNNSTLKSSKAQIIMVDVSSLIGKEIKITAANAVIDGAYYATFTTKLPTGCESLEALATFTASGYEEDKTDMINYFNVSTSNYTTNSLVTTVPQGAVYLAFTNLGTYCSEPSVGLIVE